MGAMTPRSSAIIAIILLTLLLAATPVSTVTYSSHNTSIMEDISGKHPAISISKIEVSSEFGSKEVYTTFLVEGLVENTRYIENFNLTLSYGEGLDARLDAKIKLPSTDECRIENLRVRSTASLESGDGNLYFNSEGEGLIAFSGECGYTGQTELSKAFEAQLTSVEDAVDGNYAFSTTLRGEGEDGLIFVQVEGRGDVSIDIASEDGVRLETVSEVTIEAQPEEVFEDIEGLLFELIEDLDGIEGVEASISVLARESDNRATYLIEIAANSSEGDGDVSNLNLFITRLMESNLSLSLKTSANSVDGGESVEVEASFSASGDLLTVIGLVGGIDSLEIMAMLDSGVISLEGSVDATTDYPVVAFDAQKYLILSMLKFAGEGESDIAIRLQAREDAALYIDGEVFSSYTIGSDNLMDLRRIVLLTNYPSPSQGSSPPESQEGVNAEINESGQEGIPVVAITGILGLLAVAGIGYILLSRR